MLLSDSVIIRVEKLLTFKSFFACKPNPHRPVLNFKSNHRIEHRRSLCCAYTTEKGRCPCHETRRQVPGSGTRETCLKNQPIRRMGIWDPPGQAQRQGEPEPGQNQHRPTLHPWNFRKAGKNYLCTWCGRVPPPHKHHTFLVGTSQRQNPWSTKVWGSVPNHMPTMPTSVRGGNRQNPGNQNERPHRPQHPTNSSGWPLSWTWSCHQYEQCGSVSQRGRLV